MLAKRLLVLMMYLAVLVTIAVAKGYQSDKKPDSFKIIRYGRGSIKDGKDKILSVYPRADAFFLGPRYGKRSAWGSEEGVPSSFASSSVDEDLSCSFTGVSNLYRCNTRKEPSSDEA